MKVLTMLFALTIAGKIRHSDSKVSKLQLLKQLRQYDGMDVGELMKYGFISRAIPRPPHAYNFEEDVPGEPLWLCLDRVPQRDDGCKESTEVHKCHMPEEESLRKRLPENVKWISELMVKTTTTLEDFVCNSEDGEALVPELTKMQCHYTPRTSSEKNEVEKISSLMEQSYKKNLQVFKATPTKANLCNFTKATVDMGMKMFEKSCNDNKPFEAYNRYLAASFKALCA